jgi:threonine/homoserine/homoserine lactone efflux protein
MPDATMFGLFFTAAFILAITPGPGIFYVLTRSIKGGRREGFASAMGTAVGGFVHVIAAALGLSAILATSAVAFGVVKYAGAAYLIYLGLRTLLNRDGVAETAVFTQTSNRTAFYQGITTEALNPKTALFFLAFIPQFINPDGQVFWSFIVLGTISVLLNTSADFIVAILADPISRQLKKSARLRTGQRLFSGLALIALGTFVALAGEKK